MYTEPIEVTPPLTAEGVMIHFLQAIADPEHRGVYQLVALNLHGDWCFDLSSQQPDDLGLLKYSEYFVVPEILHSDFIQEIRQRGILVPTDKIAKIFRFVRERCSTRFVCFGCRKVSPSAQAWNSDDTDEVYCQGCRRTFDDDFEPTDPILDFSKVEKVAIESRKHRRT